MSKQHEIESSLCVFIGEMKFKKFYVGTNKDEGKGRIIFWFIIFYSVFRTVIYALKFDLLINIPQ